MGHAFLSHHVTRCPATRSIPTMHCDEVTEVLVRQKKKERMFSPTWWWQDGTEGLCLKVAAKSLARTAQKSWHLESRNGSAGWRSLWNASDFCLRQPEHCPAAGANALSIRFASLTSGSAVVVLRVSNTRPRRLQTTKTIEFQSKVCFIDDGAARCTGNDQHTCCYFLLQR